MPSTCFEAKDFRMKRSMIMTTSMNGENDRDDGDHGESGSIDDDGVDDVDDKVVGESKCDNYEGDVRVVNTDDNDFGEGDESNTRYRFLLPIWVKGCYTP
ncbi:hypothetical protein CHS0354_022572 [Potamilus streckersoni]|uniref:Uncharacterized protein n=1 Tax=Potamilus streckersoni TaxID=2493646 RepID=A0AAE0SIZ1_9BIVA|nr:hypothetical protein CHS0354_022572 [Potamilus streckersoni]